MRSVTGGGYRAGARGALKRVVVGTAATIALSCALGTGLASAATIAVTTTADPVGASCPSTTNCSLRAAISAASSGDTVSLGAGTYSLTQGVQLDVNTSLTIQGSGSSATVIDGAGNLASDNQPARIMRVESGNTVGINDVEFAHGDDSHDETTCSACSIYLFNGGGAIYNRGTLNLDHVAFDSNGNDPVGGAISSNGALTLTDVSFTNNSAGAGGGLYVQGGTVVAGSASTPGASFVGNGFATFHGGAVYIRGGSASFTNSSFSGNGSASNVGGGIDNEGGTLTLNNDTLANNVRGSIETDQGAVSTSVGNTIIGAGLTEGSDWACLESGLNNGDATSTNAITTDLGHNLDEDGHCGFTNGTNGDIVSASPQLAPPADNGGGVQTLALLHGSAAFDAAGSGSCPTVDGRGESRPQGPGCDIGAFEAVVTGNSPTTANGTADNLNSSNDNAGATLHATINLRGEAGAYHFIYGTSPTSLTNTAPPVGAGVISTDTGVSEDVSGLNPGTTYWFEVVADNASGSGNDTTPHQFTTPADVPAVSLATSSPLSDTTATPGATINPEGADTTYVIHYGTDSTYGQQVGPFPVGSDTADHAVSHQIDGLNPNATYHFDVVATNTKGSTDSGDQTFTTGPTETGTAGSPLSTGTLASGNTGDCPTASIDWGDGQTSAGTVTCDNRGEGGIDWSVSGQHTYADPGHYPISTTMSDGGGPFPAGAQISPAGGTPGGGGSSSSTTTSSTTTAPPPPPPPVHGSVSGNVTKLVPYLPTAKPPAPTAGARLAVELLTASGQLHTTTDSAGNYSFPRVSGCGAAGCRIQVIDSSHQVGDRRVFSLTADHPSATVDLTVGRLDRHFLVSGRVIAPGPSQLLATAHTDLKVTVGKSEIYDALKACRTDRSMHSCRSATGSYLLADVPNRGAGRAPVAAVLTLLAENGHGKMVAVDSTRIKLPPDPSAGANAPEIIKARALHLAVPVPEKGDGRNLTGQVIRLAPYLPRATAPAPAGAAGVRVEVRSGKSTVASTKADRDGYYTFGGLNGCGPDAKPRCVVVTLANGEVSDRKPFTLPRRGPSTRTIDLLAGRITDRFVVSGTVLDPGGAHPSRTHTDIRITYKGQTFNAASVCRKSKWSAGCTSGTGSFLLTDVLPSGGDGKSKATVTLLEQATKGGLVPVDTAEITIPERTPATDASPRRVHVPDLRAVEPAPALSNPGRTVTGRVMLAQPYLPTTRPPALADARAKVELVVKTGLTNIKRDVTTDALGYYAVSGLPGCAPDAKTTCQVTVFDKSGQIADRTSFTLPDDRTTTVFANLDAGQISNRFLVAGSVVLPPGGANGASLDLWIHAGSGHETVFYDANQACAAQHWQTPCATASGGGYRLGRVIDPFNSAPVTAEIDLMYRVPGGQWTVGDRQTFTLPPYGGAGTASAPIITVPDLHLPPIVH